MAENKTRRFTDICPGAAQKLNPCKITEPEKLYKSPTELDPCTPAQAETCDVVLRQPTDNPSLTAPKPIAVYKNKLVKVSCEDVFGSNFPAANSSAGQTLVYEGDFTSYISQADADNQAQAAALFRINCYWGNKEILVQCKDGDVILNDEGSTLITANTVNAKFSVSSQGDSNLTPNTREDLIWETRFAYLKWGDARLAEVGQYLQAQANEDAYMVALSRLDCTWVNVIQTVQCYEKNSNWTSYTIDGVVWYITNDTAERIEDKASVVPEGTIKVKPIIPPETPSSGTISEEASNRITYTINYPTCYKYQANDTAYHLAYDSLECLFFNINMTINCCEKFDPENTHNLQNAISNGILNYYYDTHTSAGNPPYVRTDSRAGQISKLDYSVAPNNDILLKVPHPGVFDFTQRTGNTPEWVIGTDTQDFINPWLKGSLNAIIERQYDSGGEVDKDAFDKNNLGCDVSKAIRVTRTTYTGDLFRNIFGLTHRCNNKFIDENYDIAVPVTIEHDVMSSLIRGDAYTAAVNLATSQLRCEWTNSALDAAKCLLDNFGNEVDPRSTGSGFNPVNPVLADQFFSQVSKKDAQLKAESFNLSQLNCFWSNEPYDIRCNACKLTTNGEVNQVDLGSPGAHQPVFFRKTGTLHYLYDHCGRRLQTQMVEYYKLYEAVYQQRIRTKDADGNFTGNVQHLLSDIDAFLLTAHQINPPVYSVTNPATGAIFNIPATYRAPGAVLPPLPITDTLQHYTDVLDPTAFIYNERTGMSFQVMQGVNAQTHNYPLTYTNSFRLYFNEHKEDYETNNDLLYYKNTIATSQLSHTKCSEYVQPKQQYRILEHGTLVHRIEYRDTDATLQTLVEAGLFVSKNSRKEANSSAEAFGMTQLNCYYENDLLDVRCTDCNFNYLPGLAPRELQDYRRIDDRSSQIKQFNGHTYQRVSLQTAITWHEANTAANAAGGYLACIVNADENAFIINNYPGVDAWIGGYQRSGQTSPAANWAWVSGEPWGYTNWNYGEPNDHPNSGENSEEGFLHFYSNGMWNDLPNVENIKSYIIEYNTLTPANIVDLAFKFVPSDATDVYTPDPRWTAENSMLIEQVCTFENKSHYMSGRDMHGHYTTNKCNYDENSAVRRIVQQGTSTSKYNKADAIVISEIVGQASLNCYWSSPEISRYCLFCGYNDPSKDFPCGTNSLTRTGCANDSNCPDCWDPLNTKANTVGPAWEPLWNIDPNNVGETFPKYTNITFSCCCTKYSYAAKTKVTLPKRVTTSSLSLEEAIATATRLGDLSLNCEYGNDEFTVYCARDYKNFKKTVHSTSSQICNVGGNQFYGITVPKDAFTSFESFDKAQETAEQAYFLIVKQACKDASTWINQTWKVNTGGIQYGISGNSEYPAVPLNTTANANTITRAINLSEFSSNVTSGLLTVNGIPAFSASAYRKKSALEYYSTPNIETARYDIVAFDNATQIYRLRADFYQPLDIQNSPLSFWTGAVNSRNISILDKVDNKIYALSSRTMFPVTGCSVDYSAVAKYGEWLDYYQPSLRGTSDINCTISSAQYISGTYAGPYAVVASNSTDVSALNFYKVTSTIPATFTLNRIDNTLFFIPEAGIFFSYNSSVVSCKNRQYLFDNWAVWDGFKSYATSGLLEYPAPATAIPLNKYTVMFSNKYKMERCDPCKGITDAIFKNDGGIQQPYTLSNVLNNRTDLRYIFNTSISGVSYDCSEDDDEDMVDDRTVDWWNGVKTVVKEIPVLQIGALHVDGFQNNISKMYGAHWKYSNIPLAIPEDIVTDLTISGSVVCARGLTLFAIAHECSDTTFDTLTDVTTIQNIFKLNSLPGNILFHEELVPVQVRYSGGQTTNGGSFNNTVESQHLSDGMKVITRAINKTIQIDSSGLKGKVINLYIATIAYAVVSRGESRSALSGWSVDSACVHAQSENDGECFKCGYQVGLESANLTLSTDINKNAPLDLDIYKTDVVTNCMNTLPLAT